MLEKAEIYLDANAGAPLKHSVLEALLAFLPSGQRVLISNPSSIHSKGRKTKRVVAEAREKVAASLGKRIDPEQLVFTSSGSEANQLVIRSVLEAALARMPRPHWITTAVEHDSNRQMVAWFQGRGGAVSYLSLDSNGVPDPSSLDALFKPETVLVSVIWVNNETGVIADISAISQKTRARSIPLHIDAAQAWGKLPVYLDQLGAQYVTFSGYKIGSLMGIGVLWLARGSSVSALILGKQEKGRRGGSENVIGMVSLGAAASTLNPESWAEKVLPLRDRLEKAVLQQIPGSWINGGSASRVANTLNLNFEGVEGEGLVMALDLAGYCVSSGSACASGVLEPSHVLMAMGRTKGQATAAVRVSLTEETSWEELEGFVSALERAVSRVRKASQQRSIEVNL